MIFANMMVIIKSVDFINLYNTFLPHLGSCVENFFYFFANIVFEIKNKMYFCAIRN